MTPVFHSLGQVLPLDATVYFVRPIGRSGDGRRFYSLPIAEAWATEQQMLTGTRHEIQEALA